MTNAEKMKVEVDNIDNLARLLCDINSHDEVEDCDICPVREQCSPGHNGFKEWLNAEYVPTYEERMEALNARLKNNK